MNIVFTELISAAYGLPIDFLATYTYGWKMGRQLCEITGFILTTSGRSSKWVLRCLVCSIKCQRPAAVFLGDLGFDSPPLCKTNRTGCLNFKCKK